MVGADGRLAEPVLSWMDTRVSQPLGAVDPAVELVTSASGYLAVRLTGNRRDSAASYQGMWPKDPASGQWSTDPAELERTGMPVRLLSDLVEPGDLLGQTTPEAARETSIPAGLPVYATANDKAVEALGSGLLDEGPMLLSLGTYIAAMTVGEDPARRDDRYWVNTASVPGRYLYESGGIRRGMWTVSWLRHLVSAAAPDHVDQRAVQKWLDDGALHLPPGSGGLLTVPDWLAPGHAPYRRGTILGLDGSHGAHHLYRSILEGIALTMRGHTDAMEDALGAPLAASLSRAVARARTDDADRGRRLRSSGGADRRPRRSGDRSCDLRRGRTWGASRVRGRRRSDGRSRRRVRPDPVRSGSTPPSDGSTPRSPTTRTSCTGSSRHCGRRMTDVRRRGFRVWVARRRSPAPMTARSPARESGPSLPVRVERAILTTLLRVLQGDPTRLWPPNRIARSSSPTSS